MARRHAAGGNPGGGAGIQALRPARARLITGALALAAIGAVFAYSASTAGKLELVTLTAGSFGVTLLAVGIVMRWPAAIPWAVLATGGGYLAGREGRSLVDGWAAVVGTLLLVAAELASWSIEHDKRIRAERSLVVRRCATLAGLAGVALVVNFLLLGTAAVAASAGVVLAAIGVAAAVGAVAVVLRLVSTSP
jgi:hypothetical protein